MLVTPPAPAAWNMALDEVLLRHVIETGPVVRVYEWAPPAVSLGYGQPAADIDAAACAARGVAITRRLTGGRAVLHHLELTYSVCVPAELIGAPRSIQVAYQVLSGALAAALARLGIAAECRPRRPERAASGRDPACFASAIGGDLSVAGRKLVGSAQCHRYGGILQHGSLPLAVDEELLAACLRRPPGAARGWTSVGELGLAITPTAFAEALAAGFAPLFGAAPRVSEPGGTELAEAEALAAERYASAAWVFRL